MKVRIEGKYRSNDEPKETIYIQRLPMDGGRVLYTRTGAAPNIPALTQEYRVESDGKWIGIAAFDGKALYGSFHSNWLAQQLMGGLGLLVSADQLPEDLRELQFYFGHFQARLREDGSFTVLIERWDADNWPKKTDQFGMSEPATVRIETEWLRQN